MPCFTSLINYTRKKLKIKVFIIYFRYAILILLVKGLLKMKDFKRIIMLVLISLLILVLLIIFYALYYKSNLFLNISNITVVKVNDDKTSFNINIKGNSNETFKCIAYNDISNVEDSSNNGSCTLTLNINKDYKIYLKNDHRKTKEVNLTDYVDNILSFNFEEDIIYMVLGEDKSLKYDELVIDKNKKLKIGRAHV